MLVMSCPCVQWLLYFLKILHRIQCALCTGLNPAPHTGIPNSVLGTSTSLSKALMIGWWEKTLGCCKCLHTWLAWNKQTNKKGAYHVAFASLHGANAFPVALCKPAAQLTECRVGKRWETTELSHLNSRSLIKLSQAILTRHVFRSCAAHSLV